LYKTDRVEIALKRITDLKTKVSGICMKSFPHTPLTEHLLSRIYLCIGGANGTDLVHLPEHGSILEQSNIFIQAYNVYLSEYHKFMKSKMVTTKPDESQLRSKR
jgi:hypothetical protein